MKSIIITGASHGIGAAIARRFAKENYQLAICARNAKELELFSKELLLLGASTVYSMPVDVSDKIAAKSFAYYALEQLKNVSILVNNAGSFEPGTIADEEEGQLEKMLQTNLLSAYNITRVLLPHFKQKKQGHIVNICSVASLKAYPNGGSYSISKYALLGFSDNLREELKHDQIKVSALCPGATNSRSWSGANVPKERLMPAEDIAETVWTLCQLSNSTVLENVILRPQFGDL